MTDKAMTFEEAMAILIRHAEEQAQGWQDAYADFDNLRAAHAREVAEAEAKGYKEGFVAALSQPKYEEARRKGRAEAFREAARRYYHDTGDMRAWLEQHAAEEEGK